MGFAEISGFFWDEYDPGDHRNPFPRLFEDAEDVATRPDRFTYIDITFADDTVIRVHENGSVSVPTGQGLPTAGYHDRL